MMYCNLICTPLRRDPDMEPSLMRHKALLTATTGLVAVTLVALACSAPAWDGSVELAGSFEEVLFAGESDGRVPLAGIAEAEDDATAIAAGELVAVGALEDLTGEVTIVDGDVWLSRVRDGALSTERGRGIGGKASMLVSANVHEWSEHTVPVDIAAADLESYVRLAATDAGLDTDRPFPFRIDGELLALDAHVIAGEFPTGVADDELSSGHAPMLVAEQELRGRIVGFYAVGREGELTQPGSRLHAHVLTDGEAALTAHIESVGVKAGSVLRLPAR